ncbi:hypothetical protein [Corynebacterium cystitidis]|uniref:hypothetical protein n=1 Tax=Corynebacterium cystitidis TaxID=35757 RepID=UPI00211EF3C9|nr:hypothetical protein [Corynebacterium cystitidis]
MGASRDLTAGYETGATATLLKETNGREDYGYADTARYDASRASGRSSARTTVPHAPTGYRQRVAPHVPRTNSGRLGSKQVVSIRGRRITEQPTDASRRFSAVSLVVLPLLVLGVVVAMMFSAFSTQQTFAIQELQATETQLTNEIETLNRDLENLQSSAEVARRASEAGMVVPVTPGIVDIENDGALSERRPADPATQPMIDVNGAPVRPGRASSDPDATDDVSDSLEARPQNVRTAPSNRPNQRGETPASEAQAPEQAPGQAPAPVSVPEPAPAVAPYSPNVPAQF